MNEKIDTGHVGWSPDYKSDGNYFHKMLECDLVNCMKVPDPSRYVLDQFRALAEGAIGKDELSDSEKVAIAFFAGADVRYTFDHDTRKSLFTTEPCGFFKSDGKWICAVGPKMDKTRLE